MHAILGLILNVLWLYTLVIFAMVIMSWLIAFNVVFSSGASSSTRQSL